MAKIKWSETLGFLGWNRVKSIRRLGKLSQAEVAEGSRISIATLYNIEHGYEKTTTQETKEKLAQFFKCDVEDIFPAQMIGNITEEEYDRQKRIEREDYQNLVRQRDLYRALSKKISVEEKLWLMDKPSLYGKRLEELAKRHSVEIPPSG